MIDRSVICEEICKLVHTKRQNPTRRLLDKREMMLVWRKLIIQNKEIENLKAEVARLRKG